MPNTFRSNYVQTFRPMPTGSEGAEVLSVRATFSLSAPLAVNDVIYMVTLPANHVPVDFILDSDDLDTGATPTISLDVGLVDALGNVGQQVFAGSTVARTGGVDRPTKASAFRIAPDSSDRIIAIKVATGPATGASSGTIGLTMLYRDALYGA